MTTDSISTPSAKLPRGVRRHGRWFQKGFWKSTETGRGVRWVNLCEIAEGRVALDAALARLEKEKAGAVSQAKPRTVDELMCRALKVCEIHGILEPRTLRDYRRYAEPGRGMLSKVFGKMDPEALTSEHVKKFLWRARFPEDPSTSKPRPVAANRERSCLQKCYVIAVGEGWIQLPRGEDPFAGVSRNPEYRSTALPRDSDVQATLDTLRSKSLPHIADVCLFSEITGARQGDILSLEWADITDDGITFVEGKTRSRTGKKVTYVWTPELRAIIDRAKTRQAAVAARELEVRRPRSGNVIRRRRARPTSTLVFVNTRNQRMSQGWIAKTLRNVGSPFVFRELRPKAATAAENDETNPRNLLGHDKSMRERYHRHRRAVPLR